MNFQAIVSRFGKGTFVVILFVVAFHHWGIVNLSGIPIPYFIDMIVEHEEHGTITSSVFNPGDASDTYINGIFLQS